MNVSLIAERYARALFDLASERQSLDRIYRDVVELHEVSRENKLLRLFFRAPIVNPNKKKSVIKVMFGQKFDPLTISFINLLIGKRRDGIIPEIAVQFISQYKIARGILTVHLKSAVGVDERIRIRVREIMKNHITFNTIELVEEVDPGLIGGFILTWNDFQYDASIKRQLERMKRGVARVNLYVKGF